MQTINKSDLEIIDCTSQGCNEAILLPSIDVSSVACDINAVMECIDDISQLLHIIHTGQLNSDQIKALARLAQVTTETWAELLFKQLQQLNQSLEQSKFGTVEVQS